jgi:hypothetical protein
MTETSAITETTSAHLAAATTRDAFDCLTPFGWTGGLVVMMVSLAASFFAFGYFVIYWRNADMDFMVVYNALVMNDGKPQIFFDHPAYWTILSVKLWFRFLHSFGLLDAFSLSSVPSAANLLAFDQAMTEAIRAGRVVAWLTASGLILIFAGLARTIVRDWRLALLATFAFAFSGGVAVQMRILRSEMIAACFFTFALMIVIAVARRGQNGRPLALGIAAMLCMLGLENKVQVIVLIAALPLLALIFGTPSGLSTSFWKNSRTAWLFTGLSAICAALTGTAALSLLAAGLDAAFARQAGLTPLIAGRFGVYQAGLIAYVGLCMIVFAVVWKVSVAETLASMFCVIAGGAIGLLALNLQYNIGDVVAVVNPVEKMLSFADIALSHGGGLAGTFEVLWSGLIGVFRRYTFFLFTSARPTVFLIWLVVPGLFYAWRKGERQLALQVLVLMLVAAGLDALGVRRGLKSEYFVFTDPLIIIAGALLLDRFSDLRFHKWAYPIGATLMVLHVVVSQAEPVKHVMKRSGPQYICEWNQMYQPLMPMPWCAEPPVRP